MYNYIYLSLSLCFFPSPLPLSLALLSLSEYDPGANVFDNTPRVLSIRGYGGMVTFENRLQFHHQLAPEPFVTVPGQNHTWWRAQALRYTLRRPACFIIDKVQSELQRMFPETGEMPPHAISMHVRHGDKVSIHSAHCRSLFIITFW